MSKICIITCRNIFDSPCLYKYSKLLKGDFDIIYWDKINIEEDVACLNKFVFKKKLSPKCNLISKVFGYFKFSLFSKRILKKNHYDFLIIFPTQTAWLFGTMLKRKYKQKYTLDIRDYAGEKHFIIKKLTKRAVSNSAFCSITSEQYKKFLPTDFHYYISHNIQQVDENIVLKYHLKRKRKSVLTISFIGTVRFFEQQKKLIELFKNDSRFRLKFVGRNSDQLEEFCKDKKAKNVELIGFFEKEKLLNYYLETDFALNAYGHNNPFLDFALSNKLYSAAMMGMPIIVSPNTYMAEIIEMFGIGFVLDESDPNILDKLFDYYQNLDFDIFDLHCQKFLQEVEKDETTYQNALKTMLKLDEEG